VNDVVLAIVAGGLGRYLQDQGLAPYCLDLRIAVPMDLRPAGSEADLGNRMGAVFLALPVGIADPVARLREIESRMNVRKASLEGAVYFVLLNVLGLMPAATATSLVKTFGTRATAVVTNVRGPQERRYLAGSPLAGFLAWVPQTGPIGLGISILSYAGQVRIGILADEGLLSDPGTLLDAFEAELDLLLARALELEEPTS
jgi:WS/DGAT/MGAT family acyltransferase